MSHDHADMTAADALDALQSRFDAQEAELMRHTALVDSLVQKIAELNALIKALASSPALAVPHATFARELQAMRDNATRSATAEVERTAQAQREAAHPPTDGRSTSSRCRAEPAPQGLGWQLVSSWIGGRRGVRRVNAKWYEARDLGDRTTEWLGGRKSFDAFCRSNRVG